MENMGAQKEENIKHENNILPVENLNIPRNYRDAEHPSFWECRLKPNPHYVGAADEVCVISLSV